MRVVDLLIEKELATLENNAEYVEASNTINRLQQNILDGIADQMIRPLQEFLPSVKKC